MKIAMPRVSRISSREAPMVDGRLDMKGDAILAANRGRDGER